MYAFLWRHLPGPLAVRLLCAVLLVVGVVAFLFAIAFPWAEAHLPFLGVTVDEAAG